MIPQSATKYVSQKNEINIQMSYLNVMFIEALFKLTSIQKQFKYPSVNKEMVLYIQNGVFFVIEKKEIMSHART